MSKKANIIITLFLLFYCLFFAYNVTFFNLFDLNKSQPSSHFKAPPELVKKWNSLSKNSSIIHKDGKLILKTQILKGIKKYFYFLKGRLVLVLIDAMRYDFIYEIENGKEIIRMPFTNRLMREFKAIPFKLIANSPTVTLPRLKVKTR